MMSNEPRCSSGVVTLGVITLTSPPDALNPHVIDPRAWNPPRSVVPIVETNCFEPLPEAILGASYSG